MKSAIILAGGMGTRLKSVINNVPKPMAPVQKRPFLEILMAYWQEQGIEHFILSVGHLAHIIQEHFGDCWKGCRISYSLEQEPLGTGGGILKASKLISDEIPFLVLNGDTFFAVNLAKLSKFHLQNKANITLSVFSSSDTQRYMGIDVDPSQRVTKLNSKTKEQTCLVNGGVYIVDPVFLKSLNKGGVMAQSWENETLPKLLDQHARLFAKSHSVDFIDIGIPTDYARAQEFLFS